jgi:hypothetical protein
LYAISSGPIGAHPERLRCSALANRPHCALLCAARSPPPESSGC